MNARCERCGGPIRRTSGRGGVRRFCETCRPPRERKDRPRKRPLRPLAAVPATAGEVGGVLDATRAELTELGAPEDHWLSVLALLLARHIDNSAAETTAGVVALIHQLDATLDDLRAALGR